MTCSEQPLAETDERGVGANVDLDLNLASHEPREDPVELHQRRAHVDDLGCARRRPTQPEQLPHVLRAEVRGLANLDQFASERSGSFVLEEQFDVAADHHQDVVDVVRNGARQPRQGLDLLSLEELLGLEVGACSAGCGVFSQGYKG